MGFIENVWWLLVLIGVMILIHELGHYWAARAFDVKVEAFSFGFGPRLFGFRRGETDFRFSLILFGGYVKMAGEQVGEESAADPRSFLAKPRWQRLIIAAAGPFMNVVLAIVLVTGLFSVRYPKIPVVNSPTVGFVTPDGAAAKAGIKEGDRVLAIDDIQNPTWEDIAIKEVGSANRPMSVLVERAGDKSQDLVQVTPTLDDKNGIGLAGWSEQMTVQVAAVEPGMEAQKVGLQKGDLLLEAGGHSILSTLKLQDVFRQGEGKPVELVYEREGQRKTVMVTPQMSTIEGQSQWRIGVRLVSPVTYVALPLPEAFSESLKANYRNATLIFGSLQGIVERRMSPKSLAGPIGIAQISTEAAREGATSFISLMAMVSLNLAIFNMLPIPILDGGVILLLLIEMLMRRDLSLNVKEAVFKLGFVFLMMVVVFVLYNDISKILPG
jgi:regulator of sigma E protease